LKGSLPPGCSRGELESHGPVISAENLSFRYNAADVLEAVAFDLNQGDYLGIVGPNGSGKTTLIRLILGFERPSAGKVLLFGQDPQRFAQWYRVGYLPQKLNKFNPHFPATATEVVALGLLARKRFPKRVARTDLEVIYGALDLTESLHMKDKLFGELSGGQQQRVLIARALVSDPHILILDEPTTALDPDAREKFFAVLESLNRGKRVTIIIITHDIGTIGKYASKLLYLDKRVIFYGGFDDFCMSAEMGSYFGAFSQHLICHRHDTDGKAPGIEKPIT
jgi:zinc transport system ATP-binding protein